MSLSKYFLKSGLVCGLDEAGRGCLAGPVVAAAVILPPKFKNKLLNDSKLMKEPHREELAVIIKNAALSYGIGVVDNIKIDEINILNASFLAMHLAIDQLMIKPQLLLIDGNRFTPYSGIDHECVIKGDGKYLSIAAASVLAKTHRDTLMIELGEKHPYYEWKQNKGYPTKKHRAAIGIYGACDLHRKSFRLLK